MLKKTCEDTTGAKPAQQSEAKHLSQQYYVTSSLSKRCSALVTWQLCSEQHAECKSKILLFPVPSFTSLPIPASVFLCSFPFSLL